MQDKNIFPGKFNPLLYTFNIHFSRMHLTWIYLFAWIFLLGIFRF